MPPKDKLTKKEQTAKIASSKIKAVITTGKNGGDYKLEITGRSTVDLAGGKSGQGDHTTAYFLIEDGMKRAIVGMSAKEVDELFLLENRQRLRYRKNRIVEFISQIAALDQHKIDSLYSILDDIFRNYNEQRTKKADLRKRTLEAKKKATLDDELLKNLLTGIEAQYNQNGVKLKVALIEIIKTLLTFYNHIPNIAYFNIDTHKAAENEGPQVQKAKKDLHDAASKGGELPADQKLEKKVIGDIVAAMVTLIHYPYMNANDLIAQATLNTTKAGKPKDVRNCDAVKMADILARHIHIVLSVYPEIKRSVEQNELVNSFVMAFMSDKRQGWSALFVDEYSKLENPTQSKDEYFIGRMMWQQQQVAIKLQAIQNIAVGRSYGARQKFVEVIVSSGDEEETTRWERPEIKLKINDPELKIEVPQEDKKDEQVMILRSEYEELLRLKTLVIENKDSLPKTFQVKVQTECPNMLINNTSSLQK